MSIDITTGNAAVDTFFKGNIELINNFMMALAEKLLRIDISVTDACYRAGFSDCSRFILCFKKKFGKTPLKYKQELLKSVPV